MRVVVWITEGTWESCVDAVRGLPATDITLVHVVDPDTLAAVLGAQAGLLGRALPGAAADAARRALADTQAALLDAARARLGRPANAQPREGRVEREVIAACAGADLLVLARDGDRGRPGPRSIGHHARFVVDHAPCGVLLVWPGSPPTGSG